MIKAEPVADARPSRMARAGTVRSDIKNDRKNKDAGLVARATIEARYSEVRLEPYRETDGHGQGSGLSGEAESQFAGLRFARLAAVD
jgi:hypothetical protein